MLEELRPLYLSGGPIYFPAHYKAAEYSYTCFRSISPLFGADYDTTFFYTSSQYLQAILSESLRAITRDPLHYLDTIHFPSNPLPGPMPHATSPVLLGIGFIKRQPCPAQPRSKISYRPDIEHNVSLQREHPAQWAPTCHTKCSEPWLKAAQPNKSERIIARILGCPQCIVGEPCAIAPRLPRAFARPLTLNCQNHVSQAAMHAVPIQLTRVNASHNLVLTPCPWQ